MLEIKNLSEAQNDGLRIFLEYFFVNISQTANENTADRTKEKE